MMGKEQISIERREPIECVNCGMQMTSMNKYIISREDEIYGWYVCPRRKKNGEDGCGHEGPIALKKGEESKVKPVFYSRLMGKVQWNDKVIMLIQNNLESFETWLFNNKERFKDKHVEIAIRILD
jgi:hypothetical protein